MKQLVIVGSGGLGREVSSLAKAVIENGQSLRIKGFISDSADNLKEFSGYPPYLGKVETYEIDKNDVFVIAIAEPVNKFKCYEILKAKQAKFINLIHPTVNLTHGVQLGVGNIIHQGCIISNDCKLGNHNCLLSYVIMGHDTVVGDFNFLGAFTFFGGAVRILNMCKIFSNASISPRILLEDKAVIGIGSVVIKDVASSTTVFGNPAKVIFTHE